MLIMRQLGTNLVKTNLANVQDERYLMMLDPLYVEREWSRIEGFLTNNPNVLDEFATLSQFKKDLIGGVYQAWYLLQRMGEDESSRIDAIILTGLVEYASKKSLRIYCIAGERFREYLHLMQEFDKFAEFHEATHIEVSGREGWTRALRGDGFQVKLVLLERPVMTHRSVQ